MAVAPSQPPQARGRVGRDQDRTLLMLNGSNFYGASLQIPLGRLIQFLQGDAICSQQALWHEARRIVGDEEPQPCRTFAPGGARPVQE